MLNGTFDAAQIKKMVVNGKKNAFGDLIIFDYKNYHIIMEKDYGMWNVSVGDKNEPIQMPDDDSVSVFVRGKQIPTYFLNERCGNDIDGKLMRWCGRVVENIVAIIMDAIIEYDGEPDENERDAELNDMFEYAAETHYDIENMVGVIDDAYTDIEYELGYDEPDYEWAASRAEDMYRFIGEMRDMLGECLHRCDERTGCDIGWDDFCGVDYFDDIEITEGYSVADFIREFDGDETEFAEYLVVRIWRALDDETRKNAFRNAVNDGDYSVKIAA